MLTTTEHEVEVCDVLSDCCRVRLLHPLQRNGTILHRHRYYYLLEDIVVFSYVYCLYYALFLLKALRCSFTIIIAHMQNIITSSLLHHQPEHKIQSGAGDLCLRLKLVPKMLLPLVRDWAPKAFVISFKVSSLLQ